MSTPKKSDFLWALRVFLDPVSKGGWIPIGWKDLDWSPSAPANKLLKLERWRVVFVCWLRLGSEDT